MRKAVPVAIASNANKQDNLAARLSVLAYVFKGSFVLKRYSECARITVNTSEKTHYKVQRNAGQAELGGRLSVLAFVF